MPTSPFSLRWCCGHGGCGRSVLIGAGPDAAQDLLDASRTETMLTAAPPPGLLQVIGRYTEAGIEHIFLGYDPPAGHRARHRSAPSSEAQRIRDPGGRDVALLRNEKQTARLVE
jgi:hypothetical protein